MNDSGCYRSTYSTIKALLATLILGVTVGCKMGSVKDDFVGYQSKKVITSVEHGEYTSAYATVQYLYLKGFPRAQEKSLELMKQFPKIASGADKYFYSQFRGGASQYASIEQLRAAMQSEIDAYTKLTSAADASVANNALVNAFRESRKQYPIRYPETQIKAGQTFEQFISFVPKTPVANTELVAPDDQNLRAIVYEYKFIPPQSSGINESLSHWFAFIDNKLLFSGVGTLKEAEYQLFQQWVSLKLADKEMNLSTAYKSIYTKYQELYGQPDALTTEYVMYVIMVADKLDHKIINETESDYLLAQKRSEIAGKQQLMQAQQAEQQRQSEMLSLQKQQLHSQKVAQENAHALARSQLLLQGSLGLMQLQQNERQLQQNESMINSINQPRSYTIMPYGQGLIMKGR